MGGGEAASAGAIARSCPTRSDARTTAAELALRDRRVTGPGWRGAVRPKVTSVPRDRDGWTTTLPSAGKRANGDDGPGAGQYGAVRRRAGRSRRGCRGAATG